MSEKKSGKRAESAAGPGAAALPKRFYKDVATKDEAAGTALLLDGKTVRTPGKNRLILPNPALAEAVAGEWRAQGERIDPGTMPFTKLANSAIDGLRGREAQAIDNILAHAGSDLLCYRADGPESLVAAQARHWDPVVAWAKTALEAPFVLTEGVMPVAQAKTSLDRIEARLKHLDAFSLGALHVMTTLTGSALLPLAVLLGKLSPEQAWKAAYVDEDWQIGQWGEDAEAAARRENRRRGFEAAAKMLALVGQENSSP
ncbi:MAG: ATP12 family chaperone protein [Methyloceanibacter sp.]